MSRLDDRSDLETRVRDSLRDRATDVSASPELWEKVQGRIGARRRNGLLAVATGTVLAVAVGVVTVPRLLDDEPTRDVVVEGAPSPAPAPTAEDSEPDAGPDSGPDSGSTEAPDGSGPDVTAPTPGGTAVLPGFVVTTDGTSIDLRRSNGELIKRLHTLEAEGENTIIGLGVRPGSSTEDLTIAYTSMGEGMVTAWSLRARADDQVVLDVVVQPFPDDKQPSPGTQPFADGERTIPVFSGDGDFVAWVENTGDDASFRAFGWEPDADLPGTSQTADDNVAFSRGTVPQTLEHFSDLGPSRSGGEGYFVVLTGADGTTSTCEYERQSDGALAEIICEADYGVDQDVVDATDQLLLTRVGGVLELIDSRATSQRALPLPDEVRTADPTEVWMTGAGSHAFVGFEGRAWLVTPEGAQDLGPDLTLVVGVR